MAEEKIIWEKHTSENSDISGSRQLAEHSLLSTESVCMETLTDLAEAVPRQWYWVIKQSCSYWTARSNAPEVNRKALEQALRNQIKFAAQLLLAQTHWRNWQWKLLVVLSQRLFSLSSVSFLSKDVLQTETGIKPRTVLWIVLFEERWGEMGS